MYQRSRLLIPAILAYAKKVPRVRGLDSLRLCLHCVYSSGHESSGPLSPIKSNLFLKILFSWLTMSSHAPLVRIYEERGLHVCAGAKPQFGNLHA
jgi:hypothetical protein